MKVTVVVTALNEEKTIEKLLQALVGQTSKPNEIIIVDGGSSDDTVNLVRRFSMKNEIEVRVLVKKGNRAKGRNAGIKMTKNNIIAITDAGGYPKRDWLLKITEQFKSKEIQAVSGYYQPVSSSSFQEAVAPYFAVMPDKIHKNMEFLPSSRSIAFRKSIWKKVGGYPERYSHNEDLVFDYNLKTIGVKFFFEPDAVVYWYPPKNLFAAVKQFFRFAFGDAQAGLKRPKIRLIFLRYGAGALLLSFGFYQLLSFLVVLYIAWAIGKNSRYVKSRQGIFWLPLIQAVSDFAVMIGFLAGILSKK